jgi:hypothetical protein
MAPCPGENNAFFLNFSYVLSRACLGKLISLLSFYAKEGVFRTGLSMPVPLHVAHSIRLSLSMSWTDIGLCPNKQRCGRF